MAHYLFSSHDGFGLGHVRRNTLVARAVLAADPEARVTLVTGVAVKPAWLNDHRIRVVRVPGLLKQSSGSYSNPDMSFEQALSLRADLFASVVRDSRPDVVVVDRHPFGIGGELRPGLEQARAGGAALVLGLRDILDESKVVIQEFAGLGWQGAGSTYDEVLVYGGQRLCDHKREYGLPMTPRYTGWIAERVRPIPRDDRLLVISGGGGGDGTEIFNLGAELARRLEDHRTVIIAGPYAAHGTLAELTANARPAGRLEVHRDVAGCAELFAQACGTVQMAGYNSTFEALAAGIRPILMPRRNPRREQAIRAGRLASLGLADVIDESSGVDEIAWLLAQPRRLMPGALAAAEIDFGGARRAAAFIAALASARSVSAR
jgi:predicted glycosyltransferase